MKHRSKLLSMSAIMVSLGLIATFLGSGMANAATDLGATMVDNKMTTPGSFINSATKGWYHNDPFVLSLNDGRKVLASCAEPDIPQGRNGTKYVPIGSIIDGTFVRGAKDPYTQLLWFSPYAKNTKFGGAGDATIAKVYEPLVSRLPNVQKSKSLYVFLAHILVGQYNSGRNTDSKWGYYIIGPSAARMPASWISAFKEWGYNPDNPNSAYSLMLKELEQNPIPAGFKSIYFSDGKATQDMVAAVEAKEGKLKITKTAVDKGTYSGTNKPYDLGGAIYSVKDKDGKEVGTLMTDAKGVSGEMTLTPGTYSVVEKTAPKGFLVNDKVKTVEVVADKTTEIVLDGEYAEQIIDDPVSILVKKDSLNSALGDIPNLGGIRFKVEWFKVGNDKAGLSAVFETDKNGQLFFENATPVEGTWSYKSKDDAKKNAFPLGHVKVTEVGPLPKWWKAVSGSYEFDVIQDPNNVTESIIDNVKGSRLFKAKANTPDSWTLENEPLTGGVLVQKNDTDLAKSAPQGDGDLAGISYDIINKSKAPVSVEGKVYKVDEVVKTITTKKTGDKYIAESGDVLPYGTYQIVEKSLKDNKDLANDSYLNAGWSKNFEIRTNGEIKKFETAGELNDNKVVRGGLQVVKRDMRHRDAVGNIGAGHLDGAKFEITNRSANAVVVDGKTYKVGEVVKTITAVMNDKGEAIAATEVDTLPYGTYEVKEVGVGDGYRFVKSAKDWSAIYEIRKNGEIVAKPVKPSGDGAKDGIIYNAEKREDMNFSKKADGPGERLAGVAFKVTSVTTGETHIIATDDNGAFHSADKYRPIDKNTNSNDPDSPWSTGAVEKDKDGNYVVKDAKKLDATSGLYFAGFKDAKFSKQGETIGYSVKDKFFPVKATGVGTVGDSLYIGAFPYDKYIFEELPTPGVNDGLKMVKFTFTAHKWDAHSDDANGIDFDYGTVDDQKAPELASELTYLDGVKLAPRVGKHTFKDKLSIGGSDNKNVKWTILSELHSFNSSGKDLGVLATSTTEVKSKGMYQEVDTEYKDVDMSKLPKEAVKIVSFVEIKDDDKVVMSHKDANDDDQTLVLPEIGTSAMGTIDKEVSAVSDVITVSDMVKYKNMHVGVETEVSGTLMDKATNKPVVDGDGKEVKSSVKFTPKQPTGEIKVDFKFKKPKNFDGSTLVFFESAKIKDVEFAVHAEIEDPNQTITIPKIETTAKDLVDGDKEVPVDKDVEILDEVKYSNLMVGKKYTMCGTLHKKSDGKAFLDKDGKELTTCKEFTPDKPEGKVEIAFKINTKDLSGDTIVAFEKLSRDKIDLAVHADINDEGQSVHVPKVGTKLANVDTNIEKPSNENTVTHVKLEDTVSYSGLTAGKEYTVKGELHLRVEKDGKVTDGGVVKDKDGKPVVSEVKFKAEKPEGTVKVVFEYDYKGKIEETSVVAFEELHNDKELLAAHKDINDKNQTYKFEVKPKPPVPEIPSKPGSLAKTGAELPLALGGIALLLVVVGAVFTIMHRRNK